MNYRRLHELAEELEAYWKNLHGLYLDSVAGFSLLRQKIIKDQRFIRKWLKDAEVSAEEFQDRCIFDYSNIFSREFCASGSHQATQGEVKERNQPGGNNYKTLGQMCVVSFYDYWEDYLRVEYAIAKGVLDPSERDQVKRDKILANHVKDNFWGDMRRLRISIVHNRGIATSEVSKCKLIKWFSKGQEINLSPKMMRQIFLAVLRCRNHIFSESLPRRVLKIPTPCRETNEKDCFIQEKYN